MNRRIMTITGIIVCLCMLVSCAADHGQGGTTVPEDTKLTKELFAMDTIMDLTIYGFRKDGKKISEEELGAVMNEAVQRIHQLEELFSVTKKDSDVSKINAAEGKPVTVSGETYELLGQCLQFAEMTEGLFDVSVYPLVRLWGFTTG